jgi:hypothetical protein
MSGKTKSVSGMETLQTRSNIEDLGMMMMALMKGVDYCQGWVGQRELERFGLALQQKNPILLN